MMENFPSFPIMFGLDIAIILIALAVTLFFYRRRHMIYRTHAFFGAMLALGGVWVLTSIYIADLYSMTLMLTHAGEARAMSFMARLHTIYGWYASTAAAAMIAFGLTTMLSQILRQDKSQRAQLDLLEMHQSHFQQAAELAKVGYYIYDPDKENIEFFTDTHARNHGVGREEYARKASTLSNGMPLIHPDDRDILLKGYERVQQGETVYLSYRTTAGEREQKVREIVKPIFDENGKVVRELGTTLDVTEHIETEKLLSVAQRNEAIGQLTGGVAHDFNNLLAVIMGNLELLADELRAHRIDPELWEHAKNASLAAT